ncbi:MAG TPA: exodeoxyribonuclease VII large subunit [Bacteroidia bacterium]|jgi:exodeoxyribonuclease VII large subunit|nr:exodeoxyribonuclease VII large subunit [Bacteroidia bacterium]
MEQLRLSQFCALIDDSLKKTFEGRTWWVLAEIKERNDKGEYIYFELVEKAENGTEIIARINASVWRREAVAAFRNFEDLTGKRPERGMQVLVKAGVNYHPVYGLSLQLFDIDAQHMLGQLEMERRNTIALLSQKPGIRLENGMLLTPNKELELPSVIQHLAIITSASAAGYEDFMHSLTENIFKYRFFCTPFFSVLQGENASESMKEQLLKIFEAMKGGKKFDAVVIIRGGGAQSDLIPFDKFNLAHAVARFPVPVITGIGHLRNESIVDMVANTSTKAPTQAAEFIIDHNRSFEEEVENLRDLLAIRSNALVTKHHRKLDHVGAVLNNGTMQLLHTAQNKLGRMKEKISSSSAKLIQANKQYVGEMQRSFPSITHRLIANDLHNVELISERVKLLSPENVLKRGYAMVMKNNQPVISSKQLKKGEEVELKMKDGTINAQIT